MSRAPMIPAEKKIRIVLSIVAGKISVAQAARRGRLSRPGVHSPGQSAVGSPFD